ncbi:hypothetical protein IAU59_002680 [Kwoniella sp. CBS 9459]
MSTVVESPLPLDLVTETPISTRTIDLAPLPFKLDLSCPINLPSKPLSAAASWPFPIAGPSRIPDEELDAFVQRRYHETLYLPEAKPAERSQPRVDLIKPLLLSLPQIEKKHRRTVLPLISSSSSSSSKTANAATSSTRPDDVKISDQQRSVMRFSLDLRIGSRLAADDGVIPVPKKISDEFEKREILIQIILLFLYISSLPPAATGDQKSRKRKRRPHSHRHEPEVPEVVSPVEDPKTALELLIDRLSVWQAVADLGLDLEQGPFGGNGAAPRADSGTGQNKAGKKDDSARVGALLGKFWKSVIMPFFISTHPGLCAAFHVKVFGHTIPSKILPPASTQVADASSIIPATTTKKPRKPKVTRPMPSNDDLLLPPPSVFDRNRPRSTSHDQQKQQAHERERGISRTSSRAGSRAPSESGSRASPPPPASLLPSGSGVHMRRSLSRTSDSQSQAQSQIQSASASRLHRSRSRSIDPIARSESLSSVRNLGNASKKSLMRAPSGKDLFKSREVGLMRRTTSTALASATMSRKDSSTGISGLSREESQSSGGGGSGRFGLLGRKTSGGRETQRKSSGDESQNPNTLILATPSKPRHSHAFFGARTQSQPHLQPQGQYQHSSQSQQGWSHATHADTHAHAHTPVRERKGAGSSMTVSSRPSFIAETPANHTRIAKRGSFPSSGALKADFEMDEDSGYGDDGSDDPLGDLWENTDDEGDEDDSHLGGIGGHGTRGLMVPETPMK